MTVQGNFTAGCNACDTGISNGATLIVQGNFASGKEAQFGVTGGSSLNVAGNVDNSNFSFLTLVDGAITVQGNLDNEAFGSRRILQNGSTLTVNGTLSNGFGSTDNFTFMTLSGAGNSASAHAAQNNTLLQVGSGSSLTVIQHNYLFTPEPYKKRADFAR
jgi:hypothetical protein